MKKRAVLILITAHLVAQDLPVHQIIELDDMAYLISMTKDTNNRISYRTYPFGAINQPGFYKLANQVSNAISINSNDVTLDLGSHNVAGGIVVQNNLESVTIQNGSVDVAGAVDNALNIKNGCSRITLKNLHIKDGITNNVAMNFVSDSCIQQCDFTGSATGVFMCDCGRILLEECNAICADEEGYCMVASSSCTLRKCTATSTGKNNSSTASTGRAFGFVSYGGYGNIFDTCTADETQLPLNQESEARAAGFALTSATVGSDEVFESCSQIINCNARNGTTNKTGYASPIGFWLEEKVLNSQMLDITNFIPETPARESFSLDWSADGLYLGVGYRDISSTLLTNIYAFDYRTETFTFVTGLTGTVGYNMSWHPTGKFLATDRATAPLRFEVYEFNRLAGTLTQVATSDTYASAFFSVEWSPDGQFLAGATQTGPSLILYSFDSIDKTLTNEFELANISGSGNFNPPTPRVAWSPDGNYVAIALRNITQNLRVYRLDRVNKQFILSAAVNGGSNVYNVDWSPDGHYVAVARSTQTRVFEFIPPSTLTLRASSAGGASNTGRSVRWSPNGRYVRDRDRLFIFDRGPTPALTQVATVDTVLFGQDYATRWSPDGQYTAVISRGVQTPSIRVYRTLYMPENNVIKNCTASCNSGSSESTGFGFSGSSFINAIISNTAYDNPIDPFMVPLNYAFVINLFNPRYQDIPSSLQNIGEFSGSPIEIPYDQARMLNQLTSKLCDIQNKVDTLIAANS